MLQKSLFFILIGAIAAFGQIIINSSDIANTPGTSVTFEESGEDPIPVNLGSAGANQSWNFSSITTSDPGVQHWIDPTSTQFMPEFPDANRCSYYEGQEGNYSFYQLTSSAYQSLGFVIDYGGDSTVVINHYSTTPMINFPVNYQDEWDYVFTYDMSFINTTVHDSTHLEVDAWGTVTDITGTYQCLRIKSHKTTTTLVFGVPVFTYTMWIYSWEVPGMGSVAVMVSELGETNPNFTSGSFSRIVDISTDITEPGVSLSVEGFKLQPAYPNPFNPETNLSYSLPVGGDVSLVIFDTNGNEVSTIVNGLFSAGNHTNTWNASNLPSGIYYARLMSGNTSQTQKLILLK